MKWNHTLKGKAKRLLANKRKECEAKNIPFDLDEEWYRDRIEAGCALTNLPFVMDSPKVDTRSPSVDRINPNGGYLKSNCRLILHSLNSFKGSGNDDEMYLIASILLYRKGSTSVDNIIDQYHRTFLEIDCDKGLLSYVAKMLLNVRPTYLTDAQLNDTIYNYFTDRQRELIFKRYNQLPLTKTESEYFSRTIKKRLKGML